MFSPSRRGWLPVHVALRKQAAELARPGAVCSSSGCSTRTPSTRVHGLLARARARALSLALALALTVGL